MDEAMLETYIRQLLTLRQAHTSKSLGRAANPCCVAWISTVNP